MTYLTYGEVLEGAGWIHKETLEDAKREWNFAQRVFEVPDDFDYEAFKKLPLPRFQNVKNTYKLVYSEGNLLHEKD